MGSPVESIIFAVGTVGMLEARKGQRYLIEARQFLRAGEGSGIANPATANVRCFIAGAGTLADALAADIETRRLGDSVRLMGMIEDSRPLLWALDLFAMPSL